MPAAAPDDDDAKEVLAIYLPEWKPPAADPREHVLFESHDDDLLDEMQKLITESERESRVKGYLLTGYSLSVLHNVRLGDNYYIVRKVEINQNPMLRLLYTSQLKRLRFINSQRDPHLRVDAIEKRLFHGTGRINKEAIARDGFALGKAAHGACGKGANYATEFVRLSVEAHADAGPQCMVIVVDALVGRYCKTDSSCREPPPGFDSGGDCTGWKYAIFDNSRMYPRYFLTIERATHAQFEAEMLRRKANKRARV